MILIFKKSKMSENKPSETSFKLAVAGIKIEAATKSKFINAVDCLCGNLVNVVGGNWIAGISNKQQIKDEIQAKILKEEGNAALIRISVSPEIGDALVLQHAKSLARKATNKLLIVQQAYEELKQESVQDTSADAASELDEDWLNIFGDYAEKASSERLQSLWGSVLAGEIRKPGAFSLSTLRFISELDQKTALIFQKALKSRIDERHLLHPGKISGDIFDELTLLESVGLIQTTDDSRSIAFEHSTEDFSNHTFAKWIVFVKGQKDTEASISTIVLTRTGMEIASILPFEDNEKIVRQTAERLKQKGCTVEIAKIITRVDAKTVNHSPREVI